MLTNRQLRRNERARDKAKRARRRQEAEWERQRGKHKETPPPYVRLEPRRMSVHEVLATGMLAIIAQRTGERP